MTVAVVGGALANKPGNAGTAWTRLSWVKGLAGLGFDVHLVERLPARPSRPALDWHRAVVDWAGLAGRASLIHPGEGAAAEASQARADEVVASAALVVDISGHLGLPPTRPGRGAWVYLDLDPGYTQLWHHRGLIDPSGYDHHYTVGALVGSRWCDLPTGDIVWRPVGQPVVLDDWPVWPAPAGSRFTTVGSWRGPYGVVEDRGRTLGGKVHEFRRFAGLPAVAPGSFEVALDIDPADGGDRALLERGGWTVVDPEAVAGDPDAFRSYVRSSAAEASVAQGMYVGAATGWFGDRSVRYLASGRPVLVQDTGFSRVLPVGEGIVAFSDLDGARRGAQAILDDYRRHAAAARRIAEEQFAAPVVLGRICEEVGVAP